MVDGGYIHEVDAHYSLLSISWEWNKSSLHHHLERFTAGKGTTNLEGDFC
jgi:hypothetical protein